MCIHATIDERTLRHTFRKQKQENAASPSSLRTFDIYMRGHMTPAY